MDTWRLLMTPPARGAWNMAVDEALLEAVGRGESLPTLRLYDWAPTCLSLGLAQSYKDVDVPRLKANGWDVVRRATGGRAILHADELTYSVTAPPDEPRVRGSVLESYRRLAGALVAAIRALGLEDAARSLLARATNVESVIGRVILWETAAQAFVGAFESQLGLTFERGELTGGEKARAEELVQKKYDHPDWTERS